MDRPAADEIPVEQALAELDADLLALIQRAMAQRTTSLSSFNSIVTGNAYQSVNLRGDVAPGFRQADPHLLSGVPLRGKRFIDLGANLGEKTRLAALAGAGYAEGIEYEEFFVRIGGLINVYNRASNVVLRQGDITQPGCVENEFDVGACFSAFVYLRQNLEEVLEKIRSLFILETHAMERDWYEHYVCPIAAVFPYWVVYGFSDHGRGLEAQRRAHIAFSRDTETTGLIAINRADAISIDHHDIRMLDLAKSRRANTLMGNARRTKILFEELRGATATLGGNQRSDLAYLLRNSLPILDELRTVYNQTGIHFGTDHYWRMLFAGIVDYIEKLGMTGSNPYLVFMQDLVSDGKYNSGMNFELSSTDRAIARLGPRLERMIDTLLHKRIPAPLVVFNPLPIPALVARGYDPQDFQLDEHVHIEGRGECRMQYIDGNHQLAAMWLSGAGSCPVLPVWTNIFGLGTKGFSLFSDERKQQQTILPLISESVMTT